MERSRKHSGTHQRDIIGSRRYQIGIHLPYMGLNCLHCKLLPRIRKGKHKETHPLVTLSTEEVDDFGSHMDPFAEQTLHLCIKA